MEEEIKDPQKKNYVELSGDEGVGDGVYSCQKIISDTPVSSNDEEASEEEAVDSKSLDEKKTTSGENTENDLDEEENVIPIVEVSRFKLMQQKVESDLGFQFSDFRSWDAFVKLLHRPTDPSSLALARMLFGCLMFIDVIEERGLGIADLRWGDPDECRFPLFDFLTPLPLHWMCMLYYTMLCGATGIMTGTYFKMSCCLFLFPYWYIFFLDKTAWNNHSYLYGLLAILFLVTDSHYVWSGDAYRGKVKNNTEIPLWNYAIVRFQLFLLYFYAGLKKTEFDWLNGHSMLTLSEHWVFHPFKMLLTTDQVDLWIVHLFGFLLDLTAGFWMYFDTTRPISFLFLACFHLMNSQLFQIGMFPFVCLATMHLFCYPDWPKKFLTRYEKFQYLENERTERNPNCVYKDEINGEDEASRPSRKQRLSIILILVHVLLQLFLPYSHFITKGYNNWTNGLYGYSWDMMVHTWDTSLITIKVINLKNNDTHFMDPEIWTRNNKWQRHADMVKQYSNCLSKNLAEKEKLKKISIHLDSWVSLNNRFHQRMFNPYVNLLEAEWGPFKEVSWLMPLLTEFDHWRPALYELQKEIHSWSNASDVLFMADFPGYYIQNYIHQDITNVTLTVLEGVVRLEIEDEEPIVVSAGKRVPLPTAAFHQIHTISDSPSAYMYTFNNITRLFESNYTDVQFSMDFFQEKADNVLNAIALISRAFLRIVLNVPMVRRVKIPDEPSDLHL